MRDANPPTQPVFQSALYNDGGWGILGLILNRMTGLPYNDALGSILRKPLGLNSTVTFKPDDENLNAITVPGDFSAWGSDNQILSP
jgi:CubicO group peptidase (beta-lactamase class C family)